MPALRAVREDLFRLANHRNAVAHVGSVDASAARSDVTPLLQGLMAVLEHLHVPPDDFFGQFGALVKTQLSDQAEETAKEAEGLLAAARRAFADRYPNAGLGFNFAEALHGTEWEGGDEYQQLECPACGTEAVVTGEPGLEVDVDWDHREGTPVGGSYYVEFHAETFHCRACGLQLRSTQLQAAGIPASWPLDDANVEEYVEHYDPDYWP